MLYAPDGTFLSNYMKFMENQECPTVYDYMTGCWILSNILGRDCIVARPRAPVHLNMYLILVSESGILRKSTSIRVASSLLRQFFIEQQSKTKMIESKVSMGMVLYELSKSTREDGKAHLVLVASELAANFGRQSSTGPVVTLLTDLYDCPDVRVGGASLQSGIPSYNLKDVYVSLIAGSTPSWLEKAVTPTIIEGGFTSRCYFVVGKRRKQSIAWPVETDDTAARATLLTQLKEIHHDAATYPRIGLSDRALRTFREWYESRIIHKDPYRESFESREDSHILRFGGLFAANERCWQISDDHIRRAIELVRYIKDCGTSLFTGVTTNVADLQWIKKVREVLLRAGDAGISRMELTRAVNARGLRTTELQATLHTMHELDLIQVFEVKREGATGRPKTLYKATMYLANEQFLEDVTRKLGLE